MKQCSLALAVWLAGAFELALGQILAPGFGATHALAVLGGVPNVPGPYRGLIFLAGDASTLLIGGASAQSGGQPDSIHVRRDANGHVIGFLATATPFASAPFNDGGLAYATNGSLLVACSDNAIGEIKSGSSSFDKVVDLGTLGVTNSPGGSTSYPPAFLGTGN